MDILTCIDLVEESVIDAEYDVCMELAKSYIKYGTMYMTSPFIQEGEIWNQAKGNKNESMLKRILLFIPRLIKAIIQKIFKKSKKQIDEKADKIIKDDNPVKDSTTVELAFNPTGDFVKRIGVNITGSEASVDYRFSVIYEALHNDASKITNALDASNELLRHFNKILSEIQNISKKEFTIPEGQSPADLVKNIKIHADDALKFLNSYFNKLNDDFKDFKELEEDQRTIQLATNTCKLIDLMGKVSEAFTLTYKADIEAIEKATNLSHTDEKQEHQDSKNTNKDKVWNPRTDKVTWTPMTKEENSKWKVTTDYDEELLLRSKHMIQFAERSSPFKFTYYGHSKYIGTMSKEVRDSLFGLVWSISLEQNYERYKTKLDLLCDITGLMRDRVIDMSNAGYNNLSRGDLGLTIYETEQEQLSNEPGVILYHSSPVEGITELRPNFKSVGSDDEGYSYLEALFPTPRIYFGYNVAVSRFYAGSGITAKTIFKQKLRIYQAYQYDVMGKTIKIDQELRGKACFIETESPIRVNDVTERYIAQHQKW